MMVKAWKARQCNLGEVLEDGSTSSSAHLD